MISSIGAEIEYKLPLSQSSKFQQFFAYLDANLGHLQIESYGVAVTTLEEVFLEVANLNVSSVAQKQEYKRRHTQRSLTKQGSGIREEPNLP